MPQQFDVSKLTQSAARKITPHDNCTVLDLDLDGVGASVYPRYIEVRLPDSEGPRQTALWDGSLNLAVNDLVLCHEYAGTSTWRVMATGGDDSGAGKVRVSEIWNSTFGSVAVETDVSGNVTINGTGTLTIPTDLVHAGDPDTKWSLADDVQTFTVGGEVLLTLTEAGQDVVKIGDGGDVDINFNDDMFMRGSDGFFGVNITAPSTVTALVEAATAGNKGIVASAWSTTATFAGEPTLTLAKSHNASIGTLTETIDTERLGRMDITGVDSNDAIRSTAGFRVTQVGAASAGNVPSALDLISANNLVSMRLDENRDVIIGGGTTAFGQLTVDQPSGATAQPVLYLDQGNASQEMVEFASTIGTGNAIEAVGAKALTVTHFIKVTLPGALTRYFAVGTIA